MQILWIRHGMTPGNEERRYIGRTDESLSASGVAELLRRKQEGFYPFFSDKERSLIPPADSFLSCGSPQTNFTSPPLRPADSFLSCGAQKTNFTSLPLRPADFLLWCSPLRRCLETAGLLFPGTQPMIHPDLRECDFGLWEGKNYGDLEKDPAYQAWIDSGGRLPFPGGESMEVFRQRCVDAFREILRRSLSGGAGRMVMVVHGGTIMAVLSALADPRKEYYHWQIGNGDWIDCIYREDSETLTVQSICGRPPDGSC